MTVAEKEKYVAYMDAMVDAKKKYIDVNYSGGEDVSVVINEVLERFHISYGFFKLAEAIGANVEIEDLTRFGYDTNQYSFDYRGFTFFTLIKHGEELK